MKFALTVAPSRFWKSWKRYKQPTPVATFIPTEFEKRVEERMLRTEEHLRSLKLRGLLAFRLNLVRLRSRLNNGHLHRDHLRMRLDPVDHEIEDRHIGIDACQSFRRHVVQLLCLLDRFFVHLVKRHHRERVLGRSFRETRRRFPDSNFWRVSYGPIPFQPSMLPKRPLSY